MSQTDLRSSEITESRLADWVADWYRALDRHDDFDDLLPYLVEDGVEFHFPEGVFRGREEFGRWYDAVTNRFFDEKHTVTKVVAQPWNGDRTTVQIVVNWQATIWDAPEPASKWLGFDAYQTWEIVRDDRGRPRLRTYVVNNLQPMPGSASL